jgi:hypothetical protein
VNHKNIQDVKIYDVYVTVVFFVESSYRPHYNKGGVCRAAVNPAQSNAGRCFKILKKGGCGHENCKRGFI